jgi:hypothetical protein
MSSNDPWSAGWTKRRAASRDRSCRDPEDRPSDPDRSVVSCRALGLSESWFCKHRGRPPTPTEQRRDALDAAIIEAFGANDGEYGSPRVRAELVERPQWSALSVNTVAERLAALGLVARNEASPSFVDAVRPARTEVREADQA